MHGEFQGASCSLDDRIDHEQRIFTVEPRAGFRRGMDEMAEFSLGKVKVAHIARDEGQVFSSAKMRILLQQRFRMTTQDNC